MYSGGEGPGESYVPGDEITLGVAFTSDSKITSVEVVYAHPTSPRKVFAYSGA